MMDWNNRRVAITGGTGFIGTHLSRRLKELGADLFLLVHDRKPIEDIVEDIVSCNGDITKLGDEFIVNLKWFNPEVVFHLAAQPLVSIAALDEKPTLDVNTKGTYDFLHICKTLTGLQSFVHISTDKVYGNTSPIHSGTIAGGVHHPYNTSKLAGDQIAQMYSNFFGIPMTVIRNANVYGAGDIHFDRVVPRTIQSVLQNVKPVIRGDGSNTRDYIHVSEVVNGYIRAAEGQNKLNILNLGGFNHSVTEIVDTVLQKMGRVDLAPVFESLWNGEIPHQHIINDTAKELIDWNPKIDISEGLDLTIPWYRENKEKYGNS